MARVNGFPDSWGSKRVSATDLTGPSSYAQYTAPSTGGQDVLALPTFGIKQVDLAYGAVSASGLYRAEVVQIEAATVGGVNLSRAQLVLKWYVVSTGAQVAGAVDLSDETVRVLAVGDK